MVQRDQAVGLATAEASLGLYDRIAAGTADPAQHVDQQRLEPGRDVGLAEELHGVTVARGAGTPILDLLQVCRELGFL